MYSLNQHTPHRCDVPLLPTAGKSLFADIREVIQYDKSGQIMLVRVAGMSLQISNSAQRAK